LSRITRHTPSPAVLISSLALFVALGGTSYAAIVLPKNSVGSTQIKSNAVTSGKVRNGSLLKTDFKLGQVPSGAAGAQGPAGANGATGAAGPKGDTGAAGANGANGSNGSNGLKGDDGDDGATGLRGPSDAFYTDPFDSDGALDTTDTTLRVVFLPAGNYTLAVSAQVFNTVPSDPVDATCFLREGPEEPGAVLGSGAFTAAANGTDTRGSLAINSVYTVPAGGDTINLSCAGTGSTALDNGRIIATQVAARTLLP
jgi:Collagen triple helix repeat (20 copies)